MYDLNIWTFQAQTAARAKALRAKFERWEEKENRTNANAATHASHAAGNLNGSLDHDQSSEHIGIDTTKSLRARFESLKSESQQPKDRTPRPKVNRFVVSTCLMFIVQFVLLMCGYANIDSVTGYGLCHGATV